MNSLIRNLVTVSAYSSRSAHDFHGRIINTNAEQLTVEVYECLKMYPLPENVIGKKHKFKLEADQSAGKKHFTCGSLHVWID